MKETPCKCFVQNVTRKCQWRSRSYFTWSFQQHTDGSVSYGKYEEKAENICDQFQVLKMFVLLETVWKRTIEKYNRHAPTRIQPVTKYLRIIA
jgi:hypothetical protein